MTVPTAFRLYDLHCHTLASDGVLSAEQLVIRAHERGVNVLAITDHDTTAALIPALQAINRHQLPLQLISGVEISTLWENHEIHIVGLGMDIAHPAIVELLASQHRKRSERAAEIARRLERANIPGALEGAMALAGEGQITRGHFARYLVQCGKADTLAGVFKNYLARGKTGYVPAQWCTIEQAVEAIHLSGGRAVIAHPGRYNLSAKWLKRLLKFFAETGGDAIEVAQCQQPPDERQQLAKYAREYGLAASQGSDFHQPCAWIELGRKLWLPAGADAVWQRFPEITSMALSEHSAGSEV